PPPPPPPPPPHDMKPEEPKRDRNLVLVGSVMCIRYRGDFSAHHAGADADRDITRRDLTERAASRKAVHSDNADFCRTAALSEEKRLAAQRLTGGVMARLY
ncbi:hypothetical protein, partial [Enterobacter hormaechei]